MDGFYAFLVIEIINEPSRGDGSDVGRVFGDQGLLHEAPGYVGDVPVVRVLLPHGGEKKLLGDHLIVLFDQSGGGRCWTFLHTLVLFSEPSSELSGVRVEVVDAGHFYTPLCSQRRVLSCLESVPVCLAEGLGPNWGTIA